MNRRELFASLAALAPSARIFAQAAGPQVSDLSKNLHLIAGLGGNIAALTGPDGLLLVDSGLLASAPTLLEKSKSMSPKIAVLFNTHWHNDHTGGNVAVGEAGAKIIAHENVKKRLSTDQTIKFFDRTDKALPAIGQPVETFSTKGQLKHGGETLHYVHMPPSHTDGDATVHFQQADVLHTGDLFFNGLYPFIDYSSGGSLGGMATVTGQILKSVTAKTRIIPGHGPMATKADLQAFHDMLSDVAATTAKLMKSSKTLAEFQAAEPTKRWDDKWGKGFLKPAQFAAMLYQGESTKR